MRSAGRLLVRFGVIFAGLGILAGGLMVAFAAAVSTDFIGVAFGFAIFFGTPVLIVAAILALAGAVLAATSPKVQHAAAPAAVQPPHPNLKSAPNRSLT